MKIFNIKLYILSKIPPWKLHLIRKHFSSVRIFKKLTRAEGFLNYFEKSGVKISAQPKKICILWKLEVDNECSDNFHQQASVYLP